MRSSKRFLLLSVVLTLTCNGAAQGQAIETRLNLSTPGARSLGMGGAFIGLADDATAAYSNPAGLTSLTEGGPQVAVELRSWGYSTPYVAEGRLPGSSESGIGLDFAPSLDYEDAESAITDLSFASLGYVLPRGFTVALYKNQIANYSTEFQSEGFFFDPTATSSAGLCLEDELGQPLFCRSRPRIYGTRVKIDSLGAAIAYEFRRPFNSSVERPLSIGVSLAQYQLSFETLSATFALKKGIGLDAVDGFFGRSQFLPSNIDQFNQEVGQDSAFGINVGLLWKFGAKRNVSIGGVFRQGPEFETSREAFTLTAEENFKGRLKVPDIYGLGVSYSPPHSEGRTKVALDYQNIRYSQRLEDPFPGGMVFPSFDVADAHEVHLGLEQVVVASGKFVGTVRAGAWRESPHGLEYSGEDPTPRALYAPGDSETHWAAGLGFVIGEQYQIDMAFDRSDLAKTFSFSVVRFF